MNNLLALAAFAALAWSAWVIEHREPPPAPFIDDRYYIPCGHGCQHTPFYRGSSRRIPFYHSSDFPDWVSFGLALDEANKEGGIVVIESDVHLIGRTYYISSALITISETANNIHFVGGTFIGPEEK